MAEAGYPNGEGFPTLTLSYYDNDTVKKVVEAMAEMLKNNLNINVEVSSNEWSIFYDDVQKGNYQVAAMGWSADYVNPMSFLPCARPAILPTTCSIPTPIMTLWLIRSRLRTIRPRLLS